jgi:FlaA1/EpsC-like NDP-sugar epimerase
MFYFMHYKHVPLIAKIPERLLTNIQTALLANLALEYKVDKFVMISTDKAVNRM